MSTQPERHASAGTAYVVLDANDRVIQVGEDLRAEGPGEVLPELDDRDAVERKRHDGVRTVSRLGVAGIGPH